MSGLVTGSAFPREGNRGLAIALLRDFKRAVPQSQIDARDLSAVAQSV